MASEKEKLRQIKRQLKRGPRLSRRGRAAFALALANEYGAPLTFDKPGRRLRADVLAAIKAEVMRIANNGSRQGFKFAERMFAAYPELRGA